MRETSEVQQLISAVGWRAVECFFDDEEGEHYSFNFIPVVGWALTKMTGKYDSCAEVQLQVWHTDEGFAESIDSFPCMNSVCRALPPGQELTDELRESMGTEVRSKLKRAEDQKSKKETVA